MKSALFASHQFFASRLLLSALIAAVAAVVDGDYAWPLVWFLSIAACAVFQSKLVSRTRTAADQEAQRRLFGVRVGLSLFDTTLYAFAAAMIGRDGSAVATGFSLLVIVITMLFVLMYYFMQPKLTLLFTLPCAAALCYNGVIVGATAAKAGRPLLACLPMLGAMVVVAFFAAARQQLAAARKALVRARAEAQAREMEAKAADRAKGDFLAVMSHEIRTPLNGVLGMAQVMKREDLSAPQRERLQIISDSGECLLAILNDVLDLSSIVSGTLRLQSSEFDLCDVARGAHAAFAAMATSKGLGFDLTIETDAQCAYRGDSARVRQILYALISNAVKFTDCGEVRVLISRIEEGVRVAVHDSGIGIAAERIPGLLRTFSQGDASSTRRHGGSGLGLSIVSEIIKLMGGRLDIHSEEGRGSTFTAFVPLEPLAREPSLETAEPSDASAAGSGEACLRVLAAEDNVSNQIILRAMLNQFGIEPHVVENGREALEAWESAYWDLILMDIQMPEMDGPSATRSIRSREAETGRARTPIVAVTANAMPHQQAEYMSSGMDQFVAKPIRADRLAEALQLALGEQEGSPEVAAA